jgi:hypothetical protein
MTALCVLALAACDKKDGPKPDDPAAKNGTTTTNATTAATATAAPTPVTIADGDLSTPADFEEVAEKSITAKNYKQELSTLEADIAKE